MTPYRGSCLPHCRWKGHRSTRSGHRAGITLIELVVTLALASLLLAIALPGFSGILRNLRADTAVHLLHTHLTIARSTAVTRRVPITVCPSRGDGRCSTDSDWSHGWLMYRDRRRRNQPESDQDILRQTVSPTHSSLRLISSESRPRIRFLASGRSGGSNLTIRVCHQSELFGEVIVNNVGRVRAVRHHPPKTCAGW
ncbi:MAG: GspH/FimT family pseudopilin [Xanthomonadaceae bacterium]|jgi:type IV fimbrial biogenesis protein FimT|nr:GspH/FimT family pseudopilin [Xanthomonadaceae bacterium]